MRILKNGPALIVAMLREADPVFRQNLLKKLETAAPWLQRLYQEFEILYEDLIRLDDQSLQKLLLRTSEHDLLLAWKLTSEKFRKKILKNLSKNRVTEFQAQVSAAPRVPVRQVRRIQMHIAREARLMLERGELRMASKKNRAFL